MSTHAEGTFEMTFWDEKPYIELQGQSKLTKASIVQEFDADVVATGTIDLVMYYREDGTAVFTGYERMVGRIGDREGGFVLEATGTFDGNEARTTLTVVPGSGTDGLAGLSGSGVWAAPHGSSGTYTFDLD